ncbi:unnamed protein product, partial [Ectocarpus fasciculatus]
TIRSCAPAARPLSVLGPTATTAVSLAMGHRRLVLLGLAVVVLFAVDGAAAASKGAPRAGSQQRRSSKASRSSRPSRRDVDEDEREFQGWEGETKKGARRSSSSKSNRAARDDGSVGRRARPSSTPGSSRSSSRYQESGTSRRRSRGMELVPSRRSPPKSSMLSGLAATMKGKAASMQEDAKGKVTEWRNIAKTTVWFSSKMEKFMIQMTWPDDGALDDAWVKDTMNFLESAGNEPPRSPNNPNKRILRKLWLRMTEGDYRTKLKALQILHHTTMDLSSEANGRVRNQFMKMRDETNHKNRNEVYFEPARIMDVTSSGMPFLPLLRSYSSFTLRRMTEVQGGPKQQIASTLRSKKTSQPEAVALLRRLDKLICTGMGCKVDRKTLNTITGQVMQLTARDLMTLWRLYVKGLTRLIKGGYKEGSTPSPEAVAQLLTQYGKTQQALERYLTHFKKIVRDRRLFEDNQVDPAALQVCLASVTQADGQGAEAEEEEDDDDDDDDEQEE